MSDRRNMRCSLCFKKHIGVQSDIAHGNTTFYPLKLKYIYIYIVNVYSEYSIYIWINLFCPEASKSFGLLNTFRIKDKVAHCLLLMIIEHRHKNNLKSKSIILLKKITVSLKLRINYHSGKQCINICIVPVPNPMLNLAIENIPSVNVT